MCLINKIIYIHWCVINEHFEHKFSHGTYLELKISIRASDCLNITYTALLGCSFVTKQGPKSMFHHKRSCGTWIRLWDLSWIGELGWSFRLSLHHVRISSRMLIHGLTTYMILDPWYLTLEPILHPWSLIIDPILNPWSDPWSLIRSLILWVLTRWPPGPTSRPNPWMFCTLVLLLLFLFSRSGGPVFCF